MIEGYLLTVQLRIVGEHIHLPESVKLLIGHINL